jgi:hypothetical protein
VTYYPLCVAAVVHERRVEPVEARSRIDRRAAAPGSPASAATAPSDASSAGASIVPSSVLFGHSGILYNSNLLLYDRGAGRGCESLWIQLTGEAISGPAKDSGLRLVPITCQLVHWSDWKEAHPETTVPARDAARKERYRREPYVSYFGNDLLRFPVSPLPPREQIPWKTPCLILEAADQMAGGGDRADEARDPSGVAADRSMQPGVFPLPAIASRAGADRAWRTEWRGVPVVLRYRDRPAAVWVETGPYANGLEPPRLVIRHAFWFAWFAMNRGDVQLPGTGDGGSAGSP